MENKLTDFPIVFLDVEAAGFDSYPIEVGWAKIIKQNDHNMRLIFFTVFFVFYGCPPGPAIPMVFGARNGC